MLQIMVQHVAQIQYLRLFVDNGQHVNTEGRLHRRMLVQVVQHNIRIHIAANLHHDAHSVTVGFVAQVRNAVNPFLTNQLGDLLHKARLINLVRKLVDDNPCLTIVVLNSSLRAHRYRTASRTISLTNSLTAQNESACREIRSFDVFHQFHRCDVRILDHGLHTVDNLTKVMRRNIGSHTDGNTADTIDQKVRETGRKHIRLLFLAIIVRVKVNGFFI
ncbi:hypothetical protein D3C71_1374750 [compost metagenome]